MLGIESMPDSEIRAKVISVSALLILAGILTSGPLGSYIIQLISPQPPWVDAQTFISHYSEIQSAPFYFGFLLMFGFIIFFSSLPVPKLDWQNISGKMERVGHSYDDLYDS